jgi:shikimate dehydrogenase
MNEFFPWRRAPLADFAVIGCPIGHSLSPKMHAAAFRAAGLDAAYVAVEVQVGEVHESLDHLQSLGYRGVNVTVPHKEDAFDWCQDTTDASVRLEVCNTIDFRKNQGTNTDVIGFSASLSERVFQEKRALVLGAGGSARSIIYALESDGWSVDLWNRTISRASRLVERYRFNSTVVDQPNLVGYDLIVNSTSASLGGHRLPLDWTNVIRTAVAYDLAYGDDLTPFLIDAKNAGLSILDGRRMLMEQGAAAFEYWWGQPAPRDEMMAAIV